MRPNWRGLVLACKLKMNCRGALVTQHSLRSMLHHSRRYNLCDSYKHCVKYVLDQWVSLQYVRGERDKRAVAAIVFPVDFRLRGPAAGGLSNDRSCKLKMNCRASERSWRNIRFAPCCITREGVTLTNIAWNMCIRSESLHYVRGERDQHSSFGCNLPHRFQAWSARIP